MRKKSTPRSSHASQSRPTTRVNEGASLDELADDAKQDVGSLSRGIAILEVVVKTERPLTSSEISEAVRLTPSTTHRLLRSLSQLGYVFRDQSKRYYPSARALFPTNLFHPLIVLRRNSTEELLALRQRFGLSVALVVFINQKRWVLETIHGNNAFSPYTDTEVAASIHTLHSTVAGKIMLASMERSARASLIGPGPYDAHTSRTITHCELLERELANIVRQGYATSFDEWMQGLSAVGAPIWCSPRDPLGTVIVSGPSKNFDEATVKEIAKEVMHCAGLFSFASPDVRAACRFLGHRAS